MIFASTNGPLGDPVSEPWVVTSRSVGSKGRSLDVGVDVLSCSRALSEHLQTTSEV